MKQRTRSQNQLTRRTRLAAELLEDRTTPSTFVVSTTSTTGPGSLSDALSQADASPGPDTITFAVTGTILTPHPSGQEAPVYPSGSYAFDLRSDVTIQGPGADRLSIQVNSTGQPALGIGFWVEPGVTARISGLTVQGIKVEGAAGAITNQGNLTLDQVVVSNNAASGEAGAIYTTGTLAVTRSQVRDNSSSFSTTSFSSRGSGGVSMHGGSVTIDQSVFERNSSFWTGGAVSAIGAGSLTITRSTFDGNSAATTLVPNNDPAAYAAGRLGGGAVYAEGATVNASNSTFSGNTSGVAGGGLLFANGATATLTGVTVAANSAQKFGGGIGLSSAPAPVLRNTIVATNILSQAGNPNQPDDYTGSLGAGSGFNLIGANPAGATDNGRNGNQVGTVSRPIDPKLGPLQDNGGPTPTMALLAGSPAIDAGSSFGLTTDQRGVPRPFGSAADIGAFEASTFPFPSSGSVVLVGGQAAVQVYVAGNGGLNANGGNFNPFPGFTGSIRTAAADVTGDGIADQIFGTGPGGGPRVAIIDGATGARIADFFAFEASFTGGVYVAAGDMDGDGKAEVVVTPDRGGGPVVAVYSGAGLAAGKGPVAHIVRFFGIDDPNFRGGARAAVGDVNGDGVADLIVSAGFLGGPRIAIFDGRDVAAGNANPGRLVADFFAFEDTLRNGAFVAAGDITGDGAADLVFGGGPGGAPRVRVFDGDKLLAAGPFQTLDQIAGTAQVANFFAGDPGLRGGVRVAAKDATGDGQADLITGSGAGEASLVRVYKSSSVLGGSPTSPDQQVDPFGAVLADGVYVG